MNPPRRSVLRGALLSAWLAAGVVSGLRAGPIETPGADNVLATLRRGHPRVLVTSETIAKLQRARESDPVSRQLYAALRARAEKLLADEVSEAAVLGSYSAVREHVAPLAFCFLIEGERRYFDRAWQWMDAALRVSPWTKGAWLRAGAMAEGVGLGYDWLHAELSPEQRARVKAGLIEQAIRPALAVYADGSQFWTTAKMNWNWACNGGVGLAALAVADEEPELCGKFVALSLQSVQIPMAALEPDGAWEEGVDYWVTGLRTLMKYVAAMDTACGTTFGLLEHPGMKQTGWFPIYATSPTKRTYNFADAFHTGRPLSSPFLFTLARLQREPLFAWHENTVAAEGGLERVLWHVDHRGVTPGGRGLPLGRIFRGGNEFVTYRTAWDDPAARFVGFKAGKGGASHGHLDCGSFVFEALGVRWAVDLGKQAPYPKGYFQQNFAYYKQRAEGHNTLVFRRGARHDQDYSRPTRIVEHHFPEGRGRGDFHAIADLTPAYHREATEVRRGVRLVDDRFLLVQDEIAARQPGPVHWFMHYHTADAAERVAENAVMLRQGKQRCLVRLVAPTAARLEIRPAAPFSETPPPPSPNKIEPGYMKLAVQQEAFDRGTIAVVMIPLREDERAPESLPEIVHLSRWKNP